MFRVNAYVVTITSPSYVPSSISLLTLSAVALVVSLREISVLIRNYNLLIINDSTGMLCFVFHGKYKETFNAGYLCHIFTGSMFLFHIPDIFNFVDA